MVPALEKVPPTTRHSFSLREENVSFIETGWHTHPVFELTLITESRGTCCIGDHCTDFGPGDILLIGPYLPHWMRNDGRFQAGDSPKKARAVVVHFSEHFLGRAFFDTPELEPIKNLLHLSFRGVALYAPWGEGTGQKIEQLLAVEGYERLITLLEVLHGMSTSNHLNVLASLSYQNTCFPGDLSRLNVVYQFLFHHFAEPLSLAQVAGLAQMNVSAFCKFFKKKTGKTFSHVLNEIRIGHACRLFMEEKLAVSEVCYRCGYNNLSYFNRKFKEITCYAPVEYKKRFGGTRMAMTG